MYKSEFLNELDNNRKNRPSGLWLANSKAEKEYIRSNGCTYKVMYCYGGKIGVIRDKKTNEKISLPILPTID